MNSYSPEEEPRGWPARLGVTALNIATPGLGLIRAGRLRAGLAFAFAAPAAVLLLVAAMAVAPRPTPIGFLVTAIGGVAVTAALYFGSMWFTWKVSGRTVRPLQRWRRWYSLLAVAVLIQLLTSFVVPLGHSFYKPFYLPAESMTPTLNKGDRLLADMNDRRDLKRGEIILFDNREAMYIKRVAALAGDRIAMRRGVPVINGTPVRQTPVGRVTVLGAEGLVLLETLPGEEGAHRVIDSGYTEVDDMAEVVVPAGHVFVLGDNRDMSADSRVSRDRWGVEMLPVADVRGRALFRTWDDDFGWLGSDIN